MLTTRERELCLAHSVHPGRRRGITDTARLRDRRAIDATRGRIVKQDRRRRIHDVQSGVHVSEAFEEIGGNG